MNIIEQIENLLKNYSEIKSRKNVIHITAFETPIGEMYCGAAETGVCLLEFANRRMLGTELKELSKYFEAKFVNGENRYINQMKSELIQYFDGLRNEFTVDLDAPGTEFQKKVWKELQKIPFGRTISYKQLAQKINSPDSVRAVANANGHNRISIVIPCHRVIGEDGSLTGYGGGLARKRWLLDFENKDSKLY